MGCFTLLVGRNFTASAAPIAVVEWAEHPDHLAEFCKSAMLLGRGVIIVNSWVEV